MQIRISDVWSNFVGFNDEDSQHWHELYKSFVYKIPGAEKQYLVQLKLLCQELISKNIHSFNQLEDEAKIIIRSKRWHEKLWSWYLEKGMLNVASDATTIRRQLSAILVAKGKDPYIPLIDVANGYRFYTGHLPQVLDFCKKHGLNVTFNDGRHGSLFPNSFPHPYRNLTMRPYQGAAIVEAINSTCHPFKWQRGIFQIPTGGGKTEIAIALSMMHKGCTMFLVNRRELLHQTYERFVNAFKPQMVGIIGDNLTVIDGTTKVVVASVQTLWSKFKKNTRDYTIVDALKRNVTQIIIDEAHGVAAGEQDPINTMVKVANEFEFATHRWALTATPLMRDELSNALLTGVTGPVVFKITNDDLIKLGYLTRPKIVMTKVHHKGAYEDPLTKEELKRPTAKYWADLYNYAIVRSPQRNKAVINVLLTCPTPALVLVTRLDHINYLNHLSPVPLLFLSGTSTKEEREDAKNKIRSGTIQHLVATTIFDEGVDIPELRAIIMAGGGKSNIKTMQRLGRGLRLAAGKTEVMIYDFLDANESCPGWTPMKHSRERLTLYKKEGFEICQK